MTALRKTHFATEFAPVSATVLSVVRSPAAPEVIEETVRAGQWKNAALFLSAPFIGLLYAVLLPFVGLGMLTWFAGKAMVASPAVRKAAAKVTRFCLIAAAPLIGLAYIVALPFIGIAMLAWTGAGAVMAALRVPSRVA